MKGLPSHTSRLVAAIAVCVGTWACARPTKVEIPPTASPADEISKMQEDINAGYGYEAQYDVLAPREFAKVREWHDEAKNDIRTGQGQQEVLDDIGYARAYLKSTKEIADDRRPRLQAVLDARKTALDAGVKNYAYLRDRVRDADDRLRDAAETDQITPKTFTNIQNSYFDLELSAIQASHLDGARAKIVGARANGAAHVTPRLLSKAEFDLANGYNVVAANRHNADSFEPAVDRANQTAQLLVEVLSTAKRPGGKNMSEDMALKMVAQNRQLTNLKGKLSEAEREKSQLGQQLNKQEAALTRQDALITAAETANALDKAMDAARRDLSREEADVYREGDKLLIRLKSMNFPSGRSELPTDAFPVLSKVKGIAEDLDPEMVVIEGHTDSTGGPGLNLQLSQQRAQSVAKYLETSGLSGDKIQAVGQSYQAPIASNKTKTGRAKNRRVDVIITPSRTIRQ